MCFFDEWGELDIDPFSIDSWEDYCKVCIENKRVDVFKKNLINLIETMNMIDKKKVQEYLDRRMGEIARDELADSVRENLASRERRNLNRRRNTSIM